MKIFNFAHAQLSAVALLSLRMSGYDANIYFFIAPYNKCNKNVYH